jgi:DNA ligase-1
MKPMLAVNIKAELVRFPVFASAKLDGVRGVVIDGKLHSRSLKPVPNRHTSALFSRPELTGYDGELIVGSPMAKDAFRQTGSATSREVGEPDVKFYVFDNFAAPGGFEQRLATLKALPGVVVLEQRLVNNVAELLAFEEQVLADGYEGLILRDPIGAYKFGRSTEREQGMLKIKRFTDSEAEVLEVIEEMANNNEATKNELGRTHRSTCKAGLAGKGRAGALRVRDLSSGIVFNVATKDTADAEWFWAHRTAVGGKIVKYKSFLIGVKDAPRFPVLLGGRESWDMS